MATLSILDVCVALIKTMENMKRTVMHAMMHDNVDVRSRIRLSD